MGSSFIFMGIAGLILAIIWFIGVYISTSYGLYLLAKKYEPVIEPAFSWIPFLNLYVIIKLSQKSPWWVLGLFVPLLNIYTVFYVYHGIAVRTGRGIGTMFLLIFFMPVTLPWLWLKANDRKTTLAWLLGIGGIACIIFWYAGAFTWLILGSVNMNNKQINDENWIEQIETSWSPSVSQLPLNYMIYSDTAESPLKTAFENPKLQTVTEGTNSLGEGFLHTGNGNNINIGWSNFTLQKKSDVYIHLKTSTEASAFLFTDEQIKKFQNYKTESYGGSYDSSAQQDINNFKPLRAITESYSMVSLDPGGYMLVVVPSEKAIDISTTIKTN